MGDSRKRVVFVTGASSGIGNAVATQLAKKGFVVYGTSRSPETRHRMADEFFELIRMDVTDDDSVSTAVAYILAKEDRIDALLCCAGIGIAGAIEETPIAEAVRQMDVNFLGVARTVHAALPAMREKGGTILIIGSMAGLVGIPFQAYYSASKFALEGFVDSLRMELADPGNSIRRRSGTRRTVRLEGKPAVQVSLIQPGDFKTGFTAARAVFGLAEGSHYAETGRRALSVMAESEKTGADPILVARLVLKLLDKKKIRPRYAAGPFAQRVAMALRVVLPRIVQERILLAYYRVFERNRV
jgi:NAD(P)-dependent dehydrogenase (short-subunit alcohol dehydrogenase family)